MKGLWLLLGLLAVAALAEVPAPLPIEAAKLPEPLERLGVGGNLVTGLDGSVWLSWIERLPSGGGVLRCARLDPARRSWATRSTRPAAASRRVFIARGRSRASATTTW